MQLEAWFQGLVHSHGWGQEYIAAFANRDIADYVHFAAQCQEAKELEAWNAKIASWQAYYRRGVSWHSG